MRPQSTSATEAVTFQDLLNMGHEHRRRGALRETIVKQAAQSCFQTHGESLRAVLLTGSLARDEATFVEEKRNWRLLGDAEFLLIFHARAGLPPKVDMNFLRQKVEASISQLGITGEVSFRAAHPAYLRGLCPHIFAYELRNCGQVVGGDSEILTQIPSFSSTDIPVEDGWRLLSNRMVEQLEGLEGLEQRPKVLPRRLIYRTVKLYLDMATSFLLFAGEYAPTYAERARRLRMLAVARSADHEDPFDLRSFSDRVNECTQWKLSNTDLNSLSNSSPVNELCFSWWEEAVGYAQDLWRWELTQLTRCERQLSTEQLLQRWMRCQPVPRRLQGWLYVVRDQGWHRSWKNWPRWARLAWRASPRYWVYEVASEVFSQLPSLLNGTKRTQRPDADWEEPRSFLPVVPELEQQQKVPDWRRLAKDIAWNYQKFLVETRS
jgi:hypothetical protein